MLKKKKDELQVKELTKVWDLEGFLLFVSIDSLKMTSVDYRSAPQLKLDLSVSVKSIPNSTKVGMLCEM